MAASSHSKLKFFGNANILSDESPNSCGEPTSYIGSKAFSARKQIAEKVGQILILVVAIDGDSGAFIISLCNGNRSSILKYLLCNVINAK